MDLLERQFILVTGKGGVGKTAVAAALALVAARRRKRVLVVGLEPRDALGPRLGVEPAVSPSPHAAVPPFLHLARVDPDSAALDFFEAHLPTRGMARLLHSSSLWRTIYGATPGLKDIVVAGKLARLVLGKEPAFDHVIVDAAATGHLEALYAAVDTAVSVFGGPIGREATALASLFTDRARTAVHIVCLPEQMSILEARDLVGRAARRGIPLGALIVNDLPSPWGAAERDVALPGDLVRARLWPDAVPYLDRAMNLARMRALSAMESLVQGGDLDLPKIALPAVDDAADDPGVVRSLADAIVAPDPRLAVFIERPQGVSS